MHDVHRLDCIPSQWAAVRLCAMELRVVVTALQEEPGTPLGCPGDAFPNVELVGSLVSLRGSCAVSKAAKRRPVQD